MEIKVMYQHNNEELKLKKLSVGDWIDLPVFSVKVNGQERNENGRVNYSAGELVEVSYGFAAKLPEGYEMVILPRSSTFQKFHLLLTNSMGVVDNSYCGPNDIIKNKFYATENGNFMIGTRLAQFRIQQNQPTFDIVEVDASQMGADRGGFGSTGV